MRRVAVVTGTRAEWGLLAPVCEAIRAHGALALEVLAGGAHLLSGDGGVPTIGDVEAAGRRVHRFAMQRPGEHGRAADAVALGRGVLEIAEILGRLSPEVVLVLGDRIEAFAAASAASVGGIRVAHVHGGDRAEGIADEAMRHAITKLAHLHLPASVESASRIERLGEDRARIHLVGSPAVDGLDSIAPATDLEHASLGAPDFVFLMHPAGRSEHARDSGPATVPQDPEGRDAFETLARLVERGRVLALAPNHDPGREGIARAIAAIAARHPDRVRALAHLPRPRFLALLRHPSVRALVGNSSAGLIECAALGVRAINLGPRQGGRERADNVRDVADVEAGALAIELDALRSWSPSGRHPYLSGGASARIAQVLATFDPDLHGLRKRNAF